jgi:Zn-dependent protease
VPIELILGRAALLVPLLFALTVHEWAHAWVASLLGDDTAERQGRLTLNPLAHIDPVGTLLLPLLGVPFGWAKPVPVEPTRFRPDVTMTSGLLLTAAAGPVANLILAMLCAGTLHLIDLMPDAGHRESIETLLSMSTRINLALAIFNLLPFPPLDGSRIVDGLMPFSWRGVWNRISRASVAVLVALVLLPQLFGFGIGQWVEGLSSRLIGR